MLKVLFPFFFKFSDDIYEVDFALWFLFLLILEKGFLQHAFMWFLTVAFLSRIM